MHIVYATGSPRFLEFYLTENRQSVPPGAIVFALCTLERTVENQDEELFNALSDEEYYTLRAMVNEAVRLESERAAQARNSTQPRIRRFFRWLSGLPSRARSNGANTCFTQDSARSRRRRIVPMQRS